jgi:hypothetical protein
LEKIRDSNSLVTLKSEDVFSIEPNDRSAKKTNEEEKTVQIKEEPDFYESAQQITDTISVFKSEDIANHFGSRESDAEKNDARVLDKCKIKQKRNVSQNCAKQTRIIETISVFKAEDIIADFESHEKNTKKRKKKPHSFSIFSDDAVQSLNCDETNADSSDVAPNLRLDLAAGSSRHHEDAPTCSTSQPEHVEQSQHNDSQGKTKL